MAGRLTIAPFAAVTIDPNRDGDVNWELNPFGNPTWGQDFRSGTWIEDLVAAYLAGGPEAGAYQARAKLLTAGWLQSLPASGRDPQTLVCIAQAFPGQSWINDQIPPTVNYYAAHWMGAWNHGLMQDIKLLTIGCGYPAGAFDGDALRWRQTAVAQLTDAFEPNPLGPAIDAQGAVNEQATLYANFVYGLWRTALPELAACGYRLPGWITARIAKLPAFLGYATEPDGDLVQLGDTYVERPATSSRATPSSRSTRRPGTCSGGRGGRRPRRSTRCDSGRDGRSTGTTTTWGSPTTRRAAISSSTPGTTATPTRRTVPGCSLRRRRACWCCRGCRSPRRGHHAGHRPDRPLRQFYELYDTAFGGDPRYRSVYVSQQPDLMLVFDRAQGGSPTSAYSQLWHLGPTLRVTKVGASSAIASAPGTKLTLARVALPGQVIAPGSTQVVRGQTDPYQGWVSHQMLQRTPADVVSMTTTGPSAGILTLLVPTAPSTPVSYSTSGSPAALGSCGSRWARPRAGTPSPPTAPSAGRGASH